MTAQGRPVTLPGGSDPHVKPGKDLAQGRLQHTVLARLVAALRVCLADGAHSTARLAALAGAGGTVVPAGLRGLLVRRHTVEAVTSPPDFRVSDAPSWGTFGQWRATRCLVRRAQLARRGPVRVEE